MIGDRVNTASRVQAAAEPGERVRGRGDASGHLRGDRLRGRRQPLGQGEGRAARSLPCAPRRGRCRRGATGARASTRHSSGATPSCACSRTSSTRPSTAGSRGSSRSGPAGVGKTRLGLEFGHYMYGLADPVSGTRALPVLRGRGRLLGAGGDGPQRFGIAEEASGEEASAKLRRGSTWVADPRSDGASRRPSGRCSGPPSRGSSARTCSPAGACSSSGWPSTTPVVLVFEDIQWANDGLLDFIEQLLDWSADHPIFVFTFARPELGDAAPTGRRAFRRRPLSLSSRSPGMPSASCSGAGPGSACGGAEAGRRAG